ncbi:hypothetical protein DY000_02055226 [Brassica cretica]|uniref:Uncharacterized protein n=1 Tax=Brassica cretica TaxID=69181 RepID=A0ABQ7ALQ1_BRACR|nr:hypothetical protein DY000_02055226 [Brassica cretica]
MSRDYVSGRGFRDVWTSDAALVGGGSETSGLATQIVWGVGAETFAFDAALEGGGTETDCTSDAAYASCLFMLELNFHSGSSITQMRLTSMSDCYRAGALGVLFLRSSLHVHTCQDEGHAGSRKEAQRNSAVSGNKTVKEPNNWIQLHTHPNRNPPELRFIKETQSPTIDSSAFVFQKDGETRVNRT